ncbi:uncharacterized protein METZ01_LOCUS170443 [marine metagenome]|uniref:Uncharacterized protein n=1 Tax=marine metagenome TaxID=408172 RepID=A0A382BVG2_9ZZZZ
MSDKICEQYDLPRRITNPYHCLPNLTDHLKRWYASLAKPTMITKFYHINNVVLCLVRFLPIFTKDYQPKPIDFLSTYVIIKL